MFILLRFTLRVSFVYTFIGLESFFRKSKEMIFGDQLPEMIRSQIHRRRPFNIDRATNVSEFPYIDETTRLKIFYSYYSLLFVENVDSKIVRKAYHLLLALPLFSRRVRI